MRNATLIVVITVIATLAIDRVMPITKAQANSSSCADPSIPSCDAPERNYFSDATCGVLREIALAVELDGSTWDAAKKEPVTSLLAETLRGEGCARTLKPGGQ